MKKILIVDDDKLLNNLLKKKLTTAGYEVIIAENGDKGIKRVKEIMPDLILLDINMPVMDGYEVLNLIIKDDNLKKIPVIVISNSGHPVEMERIKKNNMVKDWIIKVDLNLNEVLEKIKKYI